MKNESKKTRWLLFTVFVVFGLSAGIFWYLHDVYQSDVSVQEFMQKSEAVTIMEIKDGLFLDGPGKDTAMIFYPGARVGYEAYLPLLHSLSEKGLDCFLVKMPYHLAVFGKKKAGSLMQSYSYDHWYLSGHSLGGAMAASYASGHLEELDGLILLAAYPTKPLQADTFSVLSVYGSEDGVLNMEKLESGRAWMPDAYEELCIEGGNHAQFGNYGEQKNDHPATISRSRQQDETAAAILNMIQQTTKK